MTSEHPLGFNEQSKFSRTECCRRERMKIWQTSPATRQTSLREERYLEDKFGDQYRRYKTTARALIR
jgi:hypothetical protein